MKKALTIFALLISVVAMGQTHTGEARRATDEEIKAFQIQQSPIFKQWNEYLSDCNKLVPDTIKQSGVVNFEYKPVIFEGKVSHFNAVPIDTVWDKVECNKYKNDGDIYGGVITNYGYSLSNWTNLASYPNITYSEPKQTKSTIKITRDKICMIKKQKASWEDFWNRWCKEQNLVKFN